MSNHFDPFSDFKIVDGVKLYRGECKSCGAEFWHKNPYKELCGDKEMHKQVAREKKEMANWGRVKPSRTPTHKMEDWSGSWDNVVSAYED
jgi:hypothetical protein